MPVPKQITWEIEPHTQAKHEILRRYLGAWFPIMGTYNERIVYIDGFCGPGRYSGGELGSPIIALREAANHAERLQSKRLTFLFMDERSDRIAHLNNELTGIQIPRNFTVSAGAGCFDVEFRKLLDHLDRNGLKLAPTFAFIDPFGFKGLPFDLVYRLLNNRKTETFINVMVDSINRFLDHPDAQTRQHIIDLFGTTDVLKIVNGNGDRVTALRLLYQEQLKKCAKFVRYFEMRNSQNRTIYYLFFASNHPLGHLKMKDAFWKIDPSSGFKFSDATNPDQLVLFEVDETSPSLAAQLQNHFNEKTLPIATVRQFVENETPFLSTHMKNALKLLEDEKRIHVEETKSDGKRRRKNSYPDDAIVLFSCTA